jgi:hypothetical protein
MLFEIGHLPLHEFVEQGDGKSRLAVALTPNHAFVDQLLPYRCYGCCLDAQRGCNAAVWCGPDPSSAIARRHFCWICVKRSNRTRKSHNKISAVNKTAIKAINNNKARRNAQALPTVFDGSTIEDR